LIHNVIGGCSVPAAAGECRDLVDPATGTVHAVAAESGAADVDAAVASAREAFGSWRHTTPADRSAMLLGAAELLEAHADELADLEVADTGKPRDVTRDEEIPASIDVVRFYAGACRLPEGRAPASTSRASRRASAGSRSGCAGRSRLGITRS
jgi:betaine-aldehyde dehydrogenase